MEMSPATPFFSLLRVPGVKFYPTNQPTSEANPTARVEGRIFFKAETGIVLFGWQGRVRSESEVQAAC